jgi:DNA polymerase III alpha subunit
MINYDKFGQAYCTQEDLCDILYKNPKQDISKFLLVQQEHDLYNKSVALYHNQLPKISAYHLLDGDIEDFDKFNQSIWDMPDEYKNLDICSWLLDQCKHDAELQRVGEELLLYQERDLFDLLKFLRYFIDTLRSNDIVWGVGRGSSVASFVLYLIGVHKINSIYYDLDVAEFLR